MHHLLSLHFIFFLFYPPLSFLCWICRVILGNGLVIPIMTKSSLFHLFTLLQIFHSKYKIEALFVWRVAQYCVQLLYMNKRINYLQGNKEIQSCFTYFTFLRHLVKICQETPLFNYQRLATYGCVRKWMQRSTAVGRMVLRKNNEKIKNQIYCLISTQQIGSVSL